MGNRTVVIFGSSRSNGNTRKILDELLSIKKSIDIIDLNDYRVGYFDYDFKNKDDDFIAIMKRVVEYETIVFASPIYWYSMSAQLKTFFDRISDLLVEGKKDHGRKLRGMNMAVISCSSDENIIEGFEMPFKESAAYLGMHYKGHLHTWVDEDSMVSKKVQTNLKSFSEMI